MIRKTFLLTNLLLIGSTCQAIDPVMLTAEPVLRTSLQIMQGAGPITDTPVPDAVPVPGTPVIKNHFLVADYQETGQYGPSGESSTGSTQVLVASKGVIRSFLKDGRIDNVLNLTHDAFFSPISVGGFTADPNVIFHPQWKQWIILGNALSSLVLAISDSDPITPDTIWSFYTVDKTSNQGFSDSSFFDYTTLGADERAIYCAANILDFNATPDTQEFFISAAAYAIPISSLTCGTEANVFAWRNLRNIGPDGDFSPFTFQPALNFDPDPAAGFFVSNELQDAFLGFSDPGKFLVNTVTFDNQDIPTLSDGVVIPVDPYVVPISVSVLGTPDTHMVQPVASFRLAPTHIRDNRLWLVSNIGVDNTGNSLPPVAIPPIGTITRDAARFVQIDVLTLDVISEGTLFQATNLNILGARSFLTPAIMSNSQGAVIIGATTCAADERLNAAVAQLTNNNTAVGPPVLYTDSISDYFATEDWEFNPFARWGDHTRISPDPEDPSVFWTAQQWCPARNTWGLEVAEIVTGNYQIDTRSLLSNLSNEDLQLLYSRYILRMSTKK